MKRKQEILKRLEDIRQQLRMIDTMINKEETKEGLLR